MNNARARAHQLAQQAARRQRLAPVAGVTTGPCTLDPEVPLNLTMSVTGRLRADRPNPVWTARQQPRQAADTPVLASVDYAALELRAAAAKAADKLVDFRIARDGSITNRFEAAVAMDADATVGDRTERALNRYIPLSSSDTVFPERELWLKRWRRLQFNRIREQVMDRVTGEDPSARAHDIAMQLARSVGNIYQGLLDREGWHSMSAAVDVGCPRCGSKRISLRCPLKAPSISQFKSVLNLWLYFRELCCVDCGDHFMEYR
jgi:hypothetical protein